MDNNEKCTLCNSTEVIINEFSPEDKPYVVRIEYSCKKCNHYWYEDN